MASAVEPGVFFYSFDAAKASPKRQEAFQRLIRGRMWNSRRKRRASKTTTTTKMIISSARAFRFEIEVWLGISDDEIHRHKRIEGYK